MDQLGNLGPLAPLAGAWEGDQGLDVSFSHALGRTAETSYRERTTFDPFGPVDNGKQILYGLDYRTAAWRQDEEDAFHTEVGYWLWDADAHQVMRCFMVPRGTVVIAGGEASPDSRCFTMRAQLGSEVFGILSNPHLDKTARTVEYVVTITVDEDDTFSYEEDTVLDMDFMDELLHHTDRNTLRRIE